MKKTRLFRWLTLVLFIASVSLFCLLVPSLFEDDSNLLIRAVLVLSGVGSWFTARTLYRNWQQ